MKLLLTALPSKPPSSFDILFGTGKENQESIEFDILEGERTIGKIKLDGLRSAPKGETQIEIVFNIQTVISPIKSYVTIH